MKFDHAKFSRDATDKGLIIELGYLSMLVVAFEEQLKNESNFSVEDLRFAYFNGAQHLFASIMQMMDDGPMETDNDLSRMNKIDEELRAFTKEAELRLAKPRGTS